MHRRYPCFPGILCAAFALCLFWLGAAAAQTTAITYQGKLTDAGNPANGDYDLQFKLFDTVTPGTGIQQGAILVRTPVTASAGVFTVALDFGAAVFDGADRYLEIGVRPAGSAVAYIVLAPRQPVTASPYAIQTLNSQKLGGLPASGFIQNTESPQAGANFNIDGKGTAGSLDINGALTQGGSTAPPVAPIGQGRMYFDAGAGKVKVSESGAPFVNLVGATGISGSGVVNSIPLWSAGTTLGSSLIAQSGGAILLPNDVQLATGNQGNKLLFGLPNGETGLLIHGGGAGRADLRFDGATLKLVAGPPGAAPPQSNGIAVTTAGRTLIGVATANAGQLSVGSTDTSLAGIYGESANRGVWGKSTGASRGVYGESISGEGVYGISGPGYGVSGNSTGGSGVFGQTGVSNATQAGVYGNATAAGGVGVMGTATTGVYGRSTAGNGIGVTGQSDTGSAIGVFGTSTSATGKGAQGESTGASGYGVYAKNLTGYALGVEGNAVQARNNSGLVKAMAYINADGSIARCFNSYLPSASSSTGNCGFTSWPYSGYGIYGVDFNFQVDDRFVSVTPRSANAVNIGVTFSFNGQTGIVFHVFIPDVNHIDSGTANAFMVIVY